MREHRNQEPKEQITGTGEYFIASQFAIIFWEERPYFFCVPQTAHIFKR